MRGERDVGYTDKNVLVVAVEILNNYKSAKLPANIKVRLNFQNESEISETDKRTGLKLKQPSPFYSPP